MSTPVADVTVGLNQLKLDLETTTSFDSEDGLPPPDGGDVLRRVGSHKGPWEDIATLFDTRPNAGRKLADLYFSWASAPDAKTLIDRLVADPTTVIAERQGLSHSPSALDAPRRSPSQDGVGLSSGSSRLVPKSPVTTLIRSTVVFPSSPVANRQESMAATRHLTPLASESQLARNLASVPHFVLADGEFELDPSVHIDPPPTKKALEVPRFRFAAGDDWHEREQQEKELLQNVFEMCAKNGNNEAVLTEEEVKVLMRDVVGLPTFLAEIVFDLSGARNPAEGSNAVVVVDRAAFEKFYGDTCEGYPPYMRLFNLLRSNGDSKYLERSNLHRVVDLLLVQHPGLALLESTPLFQLRYLETVVERTFYTCAKRHPDRLYPKELEDGGFLDALERVDQDEDINNERRFMSYEHFYVLYCRFWELDTNHDMLIDAEDLLSYGEHSLSCRIVDRIFSGAAKPLSDNKRPLMGYTDFIWFCISEEDKTSERALDYWFRCVDLDGDGVITLYDMEFFYEEQLHRMKCLGHEEISFSSIVNQLLDMLEPDSNDLGLTRAVLRNSRLQSNFFNILFNINRLFLLEGRDIRTIRLQREMPELTDWDRFALFEYQRLSAEEDDSQNVGSIVI